VLDSDGEQSPLPSPSVCIEGVGGVHQPTLTSPHALWPQEVEHPPWSLGKAPSPAEKAEADLRALQQQRDGALTADATEVNDRVLQALHALSASEGGILQLMQEGKVCLDAESPPLH